MADQTEITDITEDPSDPSEWDEWPSGYGAVIARYLEDEHWHIEGFDDTTVNVTARDGTDTGVWFARGRCWTGKGDGHGTCRNPVDILADMSDPEEIAGRAHTVMRELGLEPGKPGQRRCDDGCQGDGTLPHDGYMQQVADALEGAGIKPEHWWTETPDGERLDGVFKFDDPRINAEWPDGIYLAWDQNRGWDLITEGANRWIMPLQIGVYAHPGQVAFAALRKALNREVPPLDDSWDGAAAVLAAVEAWEAEGR